MQKKILALFGLISLIAMTVVPAVYDGQRSFRWGNDQETARLADSIDGFPVEIGGWRSVAEYEMDETTTAMLRPVSYINRKYQKGDRNAQVFVLLGPTGPTAVHIPDICFGSQSYEPLTNRVAVSIGDASVEASLFWRVQLKDRRTASGAPFLSSWYAWTIDGILNADPSPRFSYSDHRYLIKVQIVTQYPTIESMRDDPEMEKFIESITKEIRLAVRNARLRANIL